MKFGVSFSDNLIVEKKSTSGRFARANPAWWIGAGRALIFSTILCVSFFILLFRLFSLTIINGHEYRVLADGNKTKEIILHAPRGILFDRTGAALVANTPGENRTYVRSYLYPESTAHVIGYTAQISASELTDDYYVIRNYKLGDRVGRTGAERFFEERLRGRDGRELVEVDATGRALRVLGTDNEIPGENITLSLDAKLTEAVYHAFPAGEKGAVVVSNPKTGEILALFSGPTFSLNDFSLGQSRQQYESLMSNPDRPMFDRAIGGVYPPGSTFKIVTGIGALEEGAITAQTTFEDTGVITLGQFSFPNWYFLQYGKTEGAMDIVRAYKRSNDIFFYKTGEALGITKLAAWARKVGIGKPLGIELSGEAAGLVPDPIWKNLNFVSKADREARNNQWFTGDTYHISIGQGYLLTTPLQVNAWTNIIANGGKLCRPTIVKSQNANVKSQNCKDLGIKKETMKTITEGMKEACAAGGTGWPLFDFSVKTGESTTSAVKKIPVACKTGTAEFGDPKNRTHAWFTAFAPIPRFDIGDQMIKPDQIVTGEPEISVTVLVEGAGQGSDVAAPIAKKILEEWFRR